MTHGQIAWLVEFIQSPSQECLQCRGYSGHICTSFVSPLIELAKSMFNAQPDTNAGVNLPHPPPPLSHQVVVQTCTSPLFTTS
ncbi:hypothetical protein FRC02_006882 [Tulasnella sp. 418]|nr:hypothetical protein FRC02_006882 [Tulasnella sp. 418]